MSVHISLPVLFSSLPHLQHVTHVEQSHPEVMQAYSQEAAEEAALKDRDKIQDADKPDDSKQVAKDGGGDSGRGTRQDARRRKQEEEEQEFVSESSSPWTGNIVNVKI